MQDITDLRKWKWFLMGSFFNTTNRPEEVKFDTESEWANTAANGVRLGMLLVMIMHCIVLVIGAFLFVVGMLVGTLLLFACAVGLPIVIGFIAISFL